MPWRDRELSRIVRTSLRNGSRNRPQSIVRSAFGRGCSARGFRNRVPATGFVEGRPAIWAMAWDNLPADGKPNGSGTDEPRTARRITYRRFEKQRRRQCGGSASSPGGRTAAHVRPRSDPTALLQRPVVRADFADPGHHAAIRAWPASTSPPATCRQTVRPRRLRTSP